MSFPSSYQPDKGECGGTTGTVVESEVSNMSESAHKTAKDKQYVTDLAKAVAECGPQENSREIDRFKSDERVHETFHDVSRMVWPNFGPSTAYPEAQDLEHALFTEVIEKRIFKFESRNNAQFETWLYRVATTKCIDARRRQNKEHSLHEKSGFQEPIVKIEKEEIRRIAKRVLSEREFYIFSRWARKITGDEDVTLSQIGIEIGCSDDTVGKRLKEIRVKLMRAMKP
jgi:RNA polymerase sigma factor (sigma-70 family)